MDPSEFRYVWEVCNILSNNPIGLAFLNESKVFWPEPPDVIFPVSFSRETDRLAGESSGQYRRVSATCFDDIPPLDFPDVSEEFCTWESESEEGLTKGLSSHWNLVSNPAASPAMSAPPIPEKSEA